MEILGMKEKSNNLIINILVGTIGFLVGCFYFRKVGGI